jgi:glycosyltransferase involved in cell wall biosynthesis
MVQVSVLLPVRDGARGLETAARSILEGEFRDLELLIIDDGSRDSTLARAEQLAAKDDRVRVVCQGRDGLVAALNRGLAAARGSLIARMDGDDVSHPTRLAQQVAVLQARPEVAVCGCRVALQPAFGPATGMGRYIRWQNDLLNHTQMFDDRFVESIMTHATAVFQRVWLERVEGWPDPEWAEDIELWFRLFQSGARFLKIPQTLYTWTIHDKSASWNDPRYRREQLVRCKLHHLRSGPLRATPPVEIWSTGGALQFWTDALQQAGIPIARTRDLNPRRLRETRLDKVFGRTALAFYTAVSARRAVRAEARRNGWQEGVDLFCAA